MCVCICMYTYVYVFFQADDSTLEELDLSDCKGVLDGEGAAVLVGGLRTNSGLRMLDLGDNKQAGCAWHVSLAQVDVCVCVCMYM